MAAEGALDLEDLARRYDAQVLREYLLEREDARDIVASTLVHFSTEDAAEVQRPPEAYDLRLRCFRRLRLMLVINFLNFWITVAYAGYAMYLRVMEGGIQALPPLEAWLLQVLMIGSQVTLELTAVVCLTQPARASDARNGGFRSWDAVAWLAGAGGRASILLDVQCLPLMWRGSNLLFLLSFTVFVFAIGIFVFGVQLRQFCGLFCDGDHFSYDKPDLFFKGRDADGMLENPPIAAPPPASLEEEIGGDPSSHPTQDQSDLATAHRPPPVSVIKIANFAHISDLSLLHVVLSRLYMPLHCQETQEFIVSATSFSRCFCEDVIQCCVKLFFLMDIEVNPLVLVSFWISSCSAIVSCFYSSTSAMDTNSTLSSGSSND